MNHRLHEQTATIPAPELTPVAYAPVAAEDTDTTAALYRAIFEQASDGIFVADPQGHYCKVNQQACRMLGYTHAELLQFTLKDLIAPYELGSEPQSLQQMYEETPRRIECHLRCKDGSWLCVEMSMQLLSGGHLLTFVRDITARKTLEMEVRRQTTRLQAMADMAELFAAASLNVQMRLDLMVQKLVEWLGDACFAYQLADDKQWLTLVAQHTAVPLAPTLGHCIPVTTSPSPDKRTVQEQVLHRKQPLLLPIISAPQLSTVLQPATPPTAAQPAMHSLIITPICLEGQVFAILHLLRSQPDWPAFTQDDLHLVQDLVSRAALAIRNAQLYQAVQTELSWRRQAEETLRASEERFRALVDVSAQIVWTTDATGRTKEDSPSWRAFTGQSYAEWAGNGWLDVIHPDDREETARVWQQAVATGKPFISEHRIWHVQGEWRWTMARAVPLRNPDGQVRTWVGMNIDITERKRAQEQMHYQANLLQNVTDAIIATDHTFHITSWNQGAEALYGWRANEVMGKRLGGILRLIYKGEDEEQVIQHFQRQGFWKGEATHHHKNGSLLDVMSSVSLLKDSAGVVVGAVGVNRDISEQKRAEAALHQSEERFTKAFRASPAALSITRWQDGRFVDVNDSFLRMYGYARSDLIGTSSDCSPPFITSEDRAELMRRLHVQGSIRNYEMTTQSKTGDLLAVLFSIEIVEIEGEKHLLTTTFDITARKQAEERLKLALAAAQMGVWEWEVQADKLFWSPECYAIFGVEQFGNNRQAFATFVPPEDVAYVMAVFDDALTNHTVYSHEFRIIRPDGEERWVYNHGRASYDKSGKPLRVIGIVQDTTERKRAEVAQATLEEQLRQAQKMETIGRLAGGVAHDFNNLLTVIQGYCDLLLAKTVSDNPLRSKLEQIQKAGRRATALTGQLLAFSRKQMLSPTILDLNHLVANLQNMLERLIGEDITLTAVLQPGLWSITADPGQLEQVLMNLVINARDAMPTGGMLTIETANIQRDKFYIDLPSLNHQLAHPQSDTLTGACVMLAVTDTGCGMDAQTQTHMFEPFFTTKEPGKGTGLGLATVYGIIKQSGGDVSVYSEVGCGSTFKLYLPANMTASKQQTTTLVQGVPRQGHETILLVEDEEMVRKLVQAALEDKGYTILEARYASAAITLCEQYAGSIDMLMTDVVMPQMSGPELAERLAALRPGLKVLFTSGYTDDAVVRHGLFTAEVEFLPKPFSPSALALKVREVLDKPTLEQLY